MPEQQRIEHLIYAYAGSQFAVPVRDVLEIIDLPDLLQPHVAAPACVGQIVHRDHLVPILDSVGLGGGRERAPHPLKTAIVVERDGVIFGLTIDRHVAVVPLAAPPPSSMPPTAGAGQGPLIEAARAYRDDLLVVFAIAAIAAQVRRVIGDQQVVHDDEGAKGGDDALQQTPLQDFLCAQIENVSLAIPLQAVVEVIEGHEVTPLFGVHPMLRGLINLRGRVFACLDISPELNLPLRVLEERNQFVLLQDGGVDLALCVDRVEGIRSLHPHRLQSADRLLSDEAVRYVQGVLETERGPVLLLSVAPLLDTPHLQPYRSPDG